MQHQNNPLTLATIVHVLSAKSAALPAKELGLIKSTQIKLKSSFASLKGTMLTVLGHNKKTQPLCKTTMDLTHLRYDLSLHKQLEELYLSTITKETINKMDEMRYKEGSPLS